LLGVANAVVSQAVSGEGLLAFRAAPAFDAVYPLELEFTTAGAVAGTSCATGVDYVIPAQAGVTATVNADNTVKGKLTISSPSASRQVNLTVCASNAATDKNLAFSWNGGGAQGVASGLIRGASSPTQLINLNDTGILVCANATQTGVACPQTDFPGQDIQYGRDIAAAITGAGVSRKAAFLFTSVGACVQDNVTGLLWEGKTASGLHAATATYAWTDAAAYVAAVNAEKHCGFSDWRLPTVQELSSIVDNGVLTEPAIDPIFAGQQAALYRSSSEKAGDANGAWLVDFRNGAIVSTAKSTAAALRLVRGK
jgi:hypothetical protein